MDPAGNIIPLARRQRPRGGYASLASFIASDKSYCIFRRFDTLATWNLLYMQDELCEIEEGLANLDNADMFSEQPENLFSLHSRRFDKNERRVRLIQKSARKLKNYEKALLRRSSLLAAGKPWHRDVTGLSNWMKGRNPTAVEESHFLDLRSDLHPLYSPKEPKNALETFLEEKCFSWFITAKQRAKPHAASDPYVHYYSLSNIRRVARLLVVLASVLTIVGPPFALYFAKNVLVRLALIATFALVFATILTVMTACKNQEIFMIVAAYVAVMIVFVGNNLDKKE